MNHSFDIDVAREVGVNAAIMFNNFAHWYKENEANGRNYHDGKYWTFNKRSAFVKVYPYFSEKQIRTAIDKLVEAGLIEKGNYNKLAYDRTCWYTLTNKGLSICHLSPERRPLRAKGEAPEGQAIPDINPDINTDIYISRKSAESEIPSGFTEFYSLYPRKVSKAMAIKAWEKLNPDDSLLDTILADVRRRVNGEWAGKELQYVPHPSTYLNQRRWEDETATTDRVEAEEEHDLPLEEILRRGDDCSVPEGFTPCGGW
jgi:hypothetical protein